MSKKATRRAAREAFPKAKTPATTKGAYGSRSRTSVGSRSRTTPARSGMKPPSWKRAVISGVAMAVIYFLLIQYGWKSGASTLGNVIVAVIGFVIFAGVVYGIDRFKYQRYLRKQKPSSK
ncbi:MAG: hypothetical protein JW990_02320 [Thermoleophilia bacterium]|nr:hypothetical protein [Thermoleophilia bacterium]